RKTLGTPRDALCLPHLAPLVDRPRQAEGLNAFDRAVEGDPGHDFGIGEVPGGTADFPDALIRVAPDFRQMVDEFELGAPTRLVARQAAAARLMMHVHDFAEHVELELAVGGGADTERRGILIAWKPRRDPFGQAPVAADAVR